MIGKASDIQTRACGATYAVGQRASNTNSIGRSLAPCSRLSHTVTRSLFARSWNARLPPSKMAHTASRIFGSSRPPET